jgi:NAD(P)-dependent dehydrogenase (short-subunit alcohol dehydrogenase family)
MVTTKGGGTMGWLDGKVAVVTGAGSGIGAATALLMAQEGARVVAADINGDTAKSTVQSIQDAGGVGVPSETDVSDASQVQRMIETATEEWGRLDILHNNAAATSSRVMSADTTIVDVDPALWDEVMAVNLRGYFLGCKYAIPLMIEGGGGSIINTSSRAAVRGDLLRPAYGASKAGVNALTLYVATQYGRQNIRCNAITPGLAMTPAALDNLSDDVRRRHASHIPLPSWGQLEDRARMVVFLASDYASYISGQLIGIDGGVNAHMETYGEIVGGDWF